MKYFFVTAALIIFISNSFSQTTRYRDSIFSAIETTTVVFGANLDYHDVMDTLRADIYQPQQDDDTARAMIIYVHGGGFVKGTRNDSSIQALCRKLTARGYVTATIDYRIGISDHQQVSGLINASLRAVQDLNAFIRFAKTNAAQLKIDTNKIFIAGSSAGGIT
ncbi:MAG TPA: alpha/beta hydrolase, partial [Chitinophagaceae bacterium]|nr:alpha/beta hydrolase [Chitinophagaceae bacterium]